MNEALQTVVIEPKQPSNCSILWLHGLGATAHDFEDIIPFLQLPTEVSPRFVFPQAPTQPITINQGMSLPAWYDIYQLDHLDKQDQAGIELSETAIRALIDLEVANGTPSERIILAGFSQGGAMAIHTGLRYPKPLAGIFSLSGYLPLADLLPNEKSNCNHNTPLFMAHGKLDPILPFILFDLSVAELKQHGYNPSSHSYNMAHEICHEEIIDLSHWLSSVLHPAAGQACPH